MKTRSICLESIKPTQLGLLTVMSLLSTTGMATAQEIDRTEAIELDVDIAEPVAIAADSAPDPVPLPPDAILAPETSPATGPAPAATPIAELTQREDAMIEAIEAGGSLADVASDPIASHPDQRQSLYTPMVLPPETLTSIETSAIAPPEIAADTAVFFSVLPFPDAPPETVGEAAVQVSQSGSTPANRSDRLQRLEEQQQQLQQEIQELRQQLEAAPAAPAVSAAPTEADLQGVSFSATALFWQPDTSILQDYAIAGEGNPNAFVVDGDVEAVEYDSDTAVRLNLNYGFANSPIDIGVTHTFFNAEGSASVDRPANGVLFATLANPAQNESANSASAELELDYQVTGVEVGYRFDVGDRLDLRLFSGLQAASIDQELIARYDGDDFNNARIRARNNFNGYGLRLGTEANLELGAGFSLFGRVAGALMLGEMDSEFRETDEAGRDLIAELDRNTTKLIPALELAAGIDWTARVSEQVALSLGGGYEFQNWFNLVNNVRFTDNSGLGVITEDSGDLSMSGFYVRAGIEVAF